MKKLPVLLCIVLLSACEVPSDNLVQRNFIQYEINSQTPFSGVATKYHENGQLYFKRNYTNGRLNGLDEWYYENGQLRERMNYRDGEKQGLAEWYDENGGSYKRGNYKDGKSHGIFGYYRFGEFYDKGPYQGIKCYQNGNQVDMSKCK